MPQKLFERCILHVGAYAFFSECPKIEYIHFRCFFRFKTDHIFPRNAPLFPSDSENS